MIIAMHISLEKDTKGLKTRKKKFEVEKFWKLCNIILHAWMFCSIHNFINKTLSLNLWLC